MKLESHLEGVHKMAIKRGMEHVQGNGAFMTMCGERQERWPDGHENEWKSEMDGCEEAGGISRTKQKL